MPNYDEADEQQEVAEFAATAKHDAAVSFEIDEAREPTDPMKHVRRGQLADARNMELLASWNLKRIRQGLGLSQQQVADKLAEDPSRVRLSQSQLAKMERGDRPWRVNEMWDIADALGVEIWEFFGAQMGSDSGELYVLAARLQYQASWEKASRLEDDYKEAVKEGMEAGRKLVDVAAYFGIKDETAMRVLAGQAERLEEVEFVVRELEGVPSFTREQLEERDRKHEAKQARHAAWAEKEWQRLAQELGERRKADETETESE